MSLTNASLIPFKTVECRVGKSHEVHTTVAKRNNSQLTKPMKLTPIATAKYSLLSTFQNYYFPLNFPHL